MIKQLNGERRNMVNQKKIDNIANLWEKTKDPKYKNLWYEYIREFTNGPHNIKRWTVPTNSNHKTDDGTYKVIKQPKLF